MAKAGLSVVIVKSPETAVERALTELVQVLAERPDALVSFDAGVTFEPMLQAVARQVLERRLSFARLRATQPREFLGYGPDDAPGMAHELRRHCPPLQELFRDGRFLELPTAKVSKQALEEHERRIAAAGGIALQFLGLGLNGYVAGCEPHTPLGAGFDVVPLTESTRERMRWRFGDRQPPTHVVTAGPRNILETRRLVLLGFGRDKAQTAAEMLEGPVGPGPASLVQRHRSVLMVLDEEAGKLLDWPESVPATR